MADNKDKVQKSKQESRADRDDNIQQGDRNRQGGFVHSSPDANVFPPGHSQSDNSARKGGGDSAAGTPDEGRLGGSGGTSAPGTTGNDPDR